MTNEKVSQFNEDLERILAHTELDSLAYTDIFENAMHTATCLAREEFRPFSLLLDYVVDNRIHKIIGLDDFSEKKDGLKSILNIVRYPSESKKWIDQLGTIILGTYERIFGTEDPRRMTVAMGSERSYTMVCDERKKILTEHNIKMTDPEYFGVWGRYEGLEIFNRELVCSVRDIVERYTKKVEEKLIKTNKKDITSIAALTRNKTYLDEMQGSINILYYDAEHEIKKAEITNLADIERCENLTYYCLKKLTAFV